MKNKQIKLLLDVPGQSYDFSCNCHILEKTKMLTLHSRLRDCSEGSSFWFPLDINIFTCRDGGALLGKQIIPQSWNKKLHCFRDPLTFSVFPFSPNICLANVHEEFSLASHWKFYILSAPFHSRSHSSRVWNVKYISRCNSEKENLNENVSCYKCRANNQSNLLYF